MRTTTDKVLKDADEVAEGHTSGDYYLSGHPVEKLIAKLAAKLRAREALISDIYKDLQSRAQFAEDGGKVLDLSNGLVVQIQDILPKPPKKES